MELKGKQNCVKSPVTLTGKGSVLTTNSALGIYLKDTKSYVRDARIPMFPAALFIGPEIQKQPKCPSTDGGIKEVRHIQKYARTHM